MFELVALYFVLGATIVVSIAGLVILGVGKLVVCFIEHRAQVANQKWGALPRVEIVKRRRFQ